MGGDIPAYESFERKFRDAEKYKRDDVLYPVAVDDLEGTTHQVYGGLADPTYLIDADGRVSFYFLWTHAHTAIEELLKQSGAAL